MTIVKSKEMYNGTLTTTLTKTYPSGEKTKSYIDAKNNMPFEVIWLKRRKK